MSVAIIRRIAASEIGDACELLGLAFADNPSTLMNVRGDRAKAQEMMRRAVCAFKLGTRYGDVLVAEDRGDIVGVLNATPWPHCQLTTAEKLKSLPKSVRAMGRALPRVIKMTTARAKYDPHEPHWHIGPVGVHPQRQGNGIGTALLGTFLDEADQQALPAFLETDVDQNVALYQQLGFVVVATEQIMGINTRFMTRAARPTPPS